MTMKMVNPQDIVTLHVDVPSFFCLNFSTSKHDQSAIEPLRSLGEEGSQVSIMHLDLSNTTDS